MDDRSIFLTFHLNKYSVFCLFLFFFIELGEWMVTVSVLGGVVAVLSEEPRLL